MKLLLGVLMVGLLQARDLGTFGEVLMIQETSLLEHIQQKLQKLSDSGALAKHQEAIQKRMRFAGENPPPVLHIKHTTKPRTFTYDPTITVSQDLKDHQGRVFAQAGTRMNPLHYRSLSKPLLFLDGRNTTHLAWAKGLLKDHPNAQLILVAGKPLELMDQLGIRIFFDQGGTLTRKLGIQQVPARVVQEGGVLRITEEEAS